MGEIFIKERVQTNSELKMKASNLIKMYEQDKQGLIKILIQTTSQKIEP